MKTLGFSQHGLLPQCWVIDGHCAGSALYDLLTEEVLVYEHSPG
ncbi:hypothetical protein W04_0465 [Pseudoalteromonas sp. SW0106-04]|nr:hypothetical protein W04_0465 [Pseudoalteromonas sp. SW0106-04]